MIASVFVVAALVGFLLLAVLPAGNAPGRIVIFTPLYLVALIGAIAVGAVAVAFWAGSPWVAAVAAVLIFLGFLMRRPGSELAIDLGDILAVAGLALMVAVCCEALSARGVQPFALG